MHFAIRYWRTAVRARKPLQLGYALLVSAHGRDLLRSWLRPPPLFGRFDGCDGIVRNLREMRLVLVADLELMTSASRFCARPHSDYERVVHFVHVDGSRVSGVVPQTLPNAAEDAPLAFLRFVRLVHGSPSFLSYLVQPPLQQLLFCEQIFSRRVGTFPTITTHIARPLFSDPAAEATGAERRPRHGCVSLETLADYSAVADWVVDLLSGSAAFSNASPMTSTNAMILTWSAVPESMR